jgi:SAM-dependent methyltransferase
MPVSRGYGDDLAYIHDAGHSDYALKAAPGLLALLKKHRRGLVVDLGCGSGRWARELNRAGYDVLGIDQSRAMIRMARRIAPESKFKVGSLFDVDLPTCVAITSIGECLNYCFDGGSSRAALVRLFRRAYRALEPNGVLIFDVAGPERAPKDGPRAHWSQGRDWTVISRTTRQGRDRIRRRITAFREIGKLYRRSEEVHDLRFYAAGDLAKDLTACGLRPHLQRGYGRFRTPSGITVVVAAKPYESPIIRPVSVSRSMS